MIVAPFAPHVVTSATVPLHSDYQQQASLFGERIYPLPKVLPGMETVIEDGDEYQDNFKRGIVTSYSFFTGLHTIHFESVSDDQFYGRESIQAT